MVANRKIALIDLDTRRIETKAIPDKWRRNFIGGRSLGTYLACRYAAPACDPLGPGNPLVISAGLLGGTLSGLHAQTMLITQSPLTGYLECGFLPGRFAAEMRWAGFDHLVVTGRSRRWASLFIENGQVRIINTSHLRGVGATRVADELRQELRDEDVKTLSIGPAGENRVHFATIVDDMGRATGRTGLGAVLGAKRIKALACRGTLDIEIKFPEPAILHHQAGPAAKRGADAGETIELMPAGRLGKMDPTNRRQISDLGLDSGTLVHLVQGAVDAARLNPETDLVTLADQIARRKGAGRELADGPLPAAAHNAVEALPTLDLIALYSERAPDTKVGSGAPRFSHAGRCSGQYRGKPGKVGYLDMSLRLLDCLGDRTCAGICPATGRPDLERVAELIRLNSGRAIKPRGLKAAAYRCYALERLYNLKAERIARREGRHAMTLDTPGGLELSPAAWEGLDLAGFRRLVSRYYRENGWDRKSLVKKQVLDRLGMAELWPQYK